jgi:response regulator RpfG family c-di-GMP phosphodiesterase
VYDALTTPRPYQETLSPKPALRILRDQVERGWRQQVLVETFANIVGSLIDWIATRRRLLLDLRPVWRGEVRLEPRQCRSNP